MAWKTSYYHFDAVGSTRLLTDTNQNVRASCTQTAFGKQLTTGDTVVNPFRFVGQVGYYFDVATALFNVRQRIYDATIGRWLSQDPVQSDDNPFRYVENSPLRGHDPSGLVLMAFDGTLNTPESNTNVRAFFDLYQGKRFYIEGVGTGHEGSVGYVFGATFDTRINAMYDRLAKHLDRTTDRDVDIIGFSRGAAEAREFANRIKPLLRDKHARLRFIGVWDTVVALGGGIVTRTDATQGRNFELPDSAHGHAFHAMSIDENRDTFKLQRYMGAHEVWFPGVHSDVGGGYSRSERGFANESLRWMIHHARKCGVPVSAPVTYELTLASSQIVHDEMNSIFYSRVKRHIPHGDRIHISAIWSNSQSRRKMSSSEAKIEFAKLYAQNVMNDDDNWLDLLNIYALNKEIVDEINERRKHGVGTNQLKTLQRELYTDWFKVLSNP